MNTHIQVFLVGKCTKCHHYNEAIVYDYGELPYSQLDQKMDQVSHPIRPLTCTKCRADFPAEFLIYRDRSRNNDEIAKVVIEHDQIDPDVMHARLEAHDQRYALYAEHQEAFWADFSDYAIGHWTTAVNELSRAEVNAGFSALGDTRILKSDTHARREAQKVMVDHRKTFWVAANQSFIADLLDIGAMGWPPLDYANMYGMSRTRFAITYLPIGDALETLRTKHMGILYQKDKGDSSFLLRRIGQLTEEIQQQSVKYNKLARQFDQQKHIIADMQSKIGELNSSKEQLEHQPVQHTRSPEDVSRIRHLRSFIDELMNELKTLKPTANEAVPSAPELLETKTDVSPVQDLSVLQGMTIGIIGGWRKRTADQEYPCTIMIHDGRKHDPDFYELLNRSDIFVVLTRFVSHASMWAVKAYAATENKPVYHLQEINIPRILQQIVPLSD